MCNNEKIEKIFVLGFEKLGCNVINRMFARDFEGIDFALMSSDENDILNKNYPTFCTKNKNLEDCRKFFQENFSDTDMIFIISQLEKSSNNAIQIAKIAKSMGILTIGIAAHSDENISKEFKNVSDALIFFEENNLDIPSEIVYGISDLITKSGFVNIDFLDVKSILENAGTASVGVGYAEGLNRAEKAAREAVSMCGNIKNAKGILMGIKASSEINLAEMSEAINIIAEIIDNDVPFIWGHVIDENIKNGIYVTLIAGMNDNGYWDMESKKSSFKWRARKALSSTEQI